MKNCKRLWPLFLALVLALSTLTACGGKGGDAMSEEDYKAEFEKLGEDLTAIQEDSANLDLTDPDTAKKTLEDMKKPFADFINVTPPDSLKDAHEKISSGCQAMVDYIDTTLSLVGETDATKLQEASTKMGEQLQTAMTDLGEGAAMLEE